MKEVKFTKQFPNDGDAFSGVNAALDFLRQKGFSVGSMQRGDPMGIAKGDVYISKWRNLGKDVELLDGKITFPTSDPRDGDALVELYIDLEVE